MSKVPKHLWIAAAEHDRLAQFKECIASHHFSSCEGSVVRAHTIPRSQLRHIASDGHVYAVPYTHSAIVRMRHTSFEVKRVGIGDFSTLNCFCARHDKKIFAPIEDKPLIFTAEQICLLHYRALAAQFYKNRNFEESANTELLRLPEQSEDADTAAKIERFQWLSFISMKGSADVSEAIRECHLALQNAKYDKVRALIVRFNSAPTLMAVGAFRPEFDYLGRRLQDLSQPGQAGEYVALHVLVSDGKAVVLLTWLSSDEIAERFARSFANRRGDRLTSLAVQTAFEHVEEVCMSADWWNGLPLRDQSDLLDRVKDANSLYSGRRRNYLAYRASYGDWSFLSLDFTHVHYGSRPST